MNSAIDMINAMYDDFKTADQFYMQLSIHLATLKEYVNEFCVSRTVERLNLLEELGVTDESILEVKKHQPIDRPQKFFDSMFFTFAQGSSQFVAKAEVSKASGGNMLQNLSKPSDLDPSSRNDSGSDIMEILPSKNAQEKPKNKKHQMKPDPLQIFNEKVVESQEYDPGSKFQGGNKKDIDYQENHKEEPAVKKNPKDLALDIKLDETEYITNPNLKKEPSKEMVTSEIVPYKPKQALSNEKSPVKPLDNSEVYVPPKKEEKKPLQPKDILVDSVFVPQKQQEANIKPQAKPLDNSEVYIPPKKEEKKSSQDKNVDPVYVPYIPSSKKDQQPENSKSLDLSEVYVPPRKEEKKPSQQKELIDSVLIPQKQIEENLKMNKNPQPQLDTSEVYVPPKKEEKKPLQPKDILVESVFVPQKQETNIKPQAKPLDNSEVYTPPKKEEKKPPQDKNVESLYVPYIPAGRKDQQTENNKPKDPPEGGVPPKGEDEKTSQQKEVVESILIPQKQIDTKPQTKFDNSEVYVPPQKEEKKPIQPKDILVDSVFVPQKQLEAKINANKHLQQVDTSEKNSPPKQEAKKPVAKEIVESVFVPQAQINNNKAKPLVNLDTTELSSSPKTEAKQAAPQKELVESIFVPQNELNNKLKLQEKIDSSEPPKQGAKKKSAAEEIIESVYIPQTQINKNTKAQEKIANPEEQSPPKQEAKKVPLQELVESVYVPQKQIDMNKRPHLPLEKPELSSPPKQKAKQPAKQDKFVESILIPQNQVQIKNKPQPSLDTSEAYSPSKLRVRTPKKIIQDVESIWVPYTPNKKKNLETGPNQLEHKRHESDSIVLPKIDTAKRPSKEDKIESVYKPQKLIEARKEANSSRMFSNVQAEILNEDQRTYTEPQFVDSIYVSSIRGKKRSYSNSKHNNSSIMIKNNDAEISMNSSVIFKARPHPPKEPKELVTSEFVPFKPKVLPPINDPPYSPLNIQKGKSSPNQYESSPSQCVRPNSANKADDIFDDPKLNMSQSLIVKTTGHGSGGYNYRIKSTIVRHHMPNSQTTTQENSDSGSRNDDIPE